MVKRMESNENYTLSFDDLEPVELLKLPLADLDPSHVQPLSRTAEKALRELEDNICKTRVIVPPIVNKKDKGGRYNISDGHRRIAIARKLGIKHLLCQVIPSTSRTRAAQFIALNSSTRPMQGKERGQSLAATRSADELEKCLEMCSKAQRDQWEGAVAILGEKRVKELVASGKSVASLAKAVGQVEWLYTVPGYFDSEQPNSKKIAEWILENNMLRTIDSMYRYAAKSNRKQLLRAIAENRPYAGPRA